MKRIVQPEILDSLPQEHPDALANRRDLRLINGIMGNFRWFRRSLSAYLRPTDRLLEIGAGTGDLGLALCSHQKDASSFSHYSALDLWSRPPNWPAEWSWFQEDLLASNRYSGATVLLANLILHQFEEADLDRLREKIVRSGIRMILASEPARHRLHQHQLHLLRPLGLNRVSRHDGHVSVAAGFRGGELPNLLGLDANIWKVDVERGFLGWYRMIAIRKEGKSA